MSRLSAVKITLNASRLSSRDIRRLRATCRESNGLPWASLAKRLPRMTVGSCTRSLRSTKEMSLRSGWRQLCSKLLSNDWVSGFHRNPATEAILAYSQLKSPLASKQLRSRHRPPRLHLRLHQINRHQELLNVERLSRPRPFPILRDFRLQGGSL